MTNKVTIAEEPALRVAEIIKKKGYLLGDVTGMREDEPDLDCISVLKERPPVKQKVLWWYREKEQRALVIAEIWISNEMRGAKAKKHWVVETFGRDYLWEVKDLVADLVREFGVKIEIILKSEKASTETLWSDYEY